MPTWNPEPRAQLNKEAELLSAFIAEGNVSALFYSAIKFIYLFGFFFERTDSTPIHVKASMCKTAPHTSCAFCFISIVLGWHVPS